MEKKLATILVTAVLSLGSLFVVGCESNAQVGSAIGALAGAGIGQLAGGDTEATLIKNRTYWRRRSGGWEQGEEPCVTKQHYILDVLNIIARCMFKIE